MNSAIAFAGAARRALLLAAVASAAIATSAPGQTVTPVLRTAPLNDTDCNFETANPVTAVPPCTVNGTRNATYNGRTRTVRNATSDLLTDTYSVAYSGDLKVDGLPVATGPNFLYPFGNPTGAGAGPVDASYFFGTTGQTVNVTTSYTGERIQVVATGAAGSPVPTDPPAYWSRVTNLTGTVNSIAIDLDSYFETSDGGEYDYQLASVNPANVVVNATALAGRFHGNAGTGAIQFGTLAGTATVTGGYGVTPYPADTGATNTGLLSLYRLGYDVAATVTTNLDETGLTTPRVTVSQGIEMNGSKITGLAAGTAAGDAVNKAQLDAAISGAGTGSAYFAGNSTGTAASATGDDAVAVGEAAVASGGVAVALGANATASGYASSATGTDSAASGFQAMSNGVFARAVGDYSMAFGRATFATGTQAMAMGPLASANGANSTAIGGEAVAGTAGATALGALATANHANSTAVGTGATTTAANQLVLGNAQTAVVVAGIDASTDAQQGPVDVVTVDAAGTLGRQRVASAQSVQAVSSQMEYIAAVTDSQFSALSNQVSDLSFRLDDLSRSTSGGIAAAMALGGTIIVPDSTVSVSVNASTYRGEQGYSGVVAARVTEKVYVTGGIAGSSAKRSTGGRVGMAVGF